MNATTSASSCYLLLTLLACGTLAADRPIFLLHLPKAAVGAIEVNDFRRAVQTHRDPQLRDSDKRDFEQPSAWCYVSSSVVIDVYARAYKQSCAQSYVGALLRQKKVLL